MSSFLATERWAEKLLFRRLRKKSGKVSSSFCRNNDTKWDKMTTIFGELVNKARKDEKQSFRFLFFVERWSLRSQRSAWKLCAWARKEMKNDMKMMFDKWHDKIAKIYFDKIRNWIASMRKRDRKMNAKFLFDNSIDSNWKLTSSNRQKAVALPFTWCDLPKSKVIQFYYAFHGFTSAHLTSQDATQTSSWFVMSSSSFVHRNSMMILNLSVLALLFFCSWWFYRVTLGVCFCYFSWEFRFVRL